jgi:hypothetical protein
MAGSSNNGPRPLFMAAVAVTMGIGAAAVPDLAPVQARVDCTATLVPDTVFAGADPAVVGYALSESIGTVSKVVPAEDSKLEVSGLDVEKSTFVLDASGAEPGAWGLTFQGENVTCSGRVNVRSMR